MFQLHQQSKTNDHAVLEAEVLQVHAPPFVTKETNSSQAIGPAFSRVQRRKSFIKKVFPFCLLFVHKCIYKYVNEQFLESSTCFSMFFRKDVIVYQSYCPTETQRVVLKCRQ